MTASIGTRVSYEDMANPLRVGEIVGEVAGQWAVVWDRETPSCDACGSTDLCFGVDENDVEDGTYVCEECGERGGRELLEQGGVRFHTTVTKDMLARADQRQRQFRAENRGGRCGGWAIDPQPSATDVFHQRGLALTRAQRTEVLAASFRDTDALLATPAMTSDQRAEIATARGWIMTVLEERGELAAIGLDPEYRQLLSPGDRVRIVSEKSRLHGALATVTADDPQQTIVQPDGEAESPVSVWKSDDLVRLERVEDAPCVACGAPESGHDPGCPLS